MKNKKIIIIAVAVITIIAIALNIYMTEQSQKEDAVTIQMGTSSTVYLNEKNFDKCSPQNMSVTMTRKNGEKIPKDYYAASAEDVFAHLKVKEDFVEFSAVAADNFRAKFTKEELADNVYITYEKESNSFGIIVLKDEFSTRFIRDLKILEIEYGGD